MLGAPDEALITRALARAKETEASGLVDIVELRAELYERVMLQQVVLGWHILFGPLVAGLDQRARPQRPTPKKETARLDSKKPIFGEEKQT